MRILFFVGGVLFCLNSGVWAASYPSQARSSKALSSEVTQPNHVQFAPEIGLVFNSYSETGMSDIDQLSTLLGFGSWIPVGNDWAIHSDNTVHFGLVGSRASHFSTLKLNQRFGRMIPVTPLWQAAVMGGLRYSTMWSEEDAFGYENLFGFQAYGELARSLDENSYAKAALSTTLGPSFFEWALEPSYGRRVFSDKTFFVKARISALYFNEESTEIRDLTSAMNVGFGF